MGLCLWPRDGGRCVEGATQGGEHHGVSTGTRAMRPCGDGTGCTRPTLVPPTPTPRRCGWWRVYRRQVGWRWRWRALEKVPHRSRRRSASGNRHRRCHRGGRLHGHTVSCGGEGHGWGCWRHPHTVVRRGRGGPCAVGMTVGVAVVLPIREAIGIGMAVGMTISVTISVTVGVAVGVAVGRVGGPREDRGETTKASQETLSRRLHGPRC
mmetsp:Transcript_54314/g.128275  ORF Transcript_54314/g.128275 Transcript_54314/m.128275 type:complete len:209 (-) Transcript_54314:650-1276(-)